MLFVQLILLTTTIRQIAGVSNDAIITHFESGSELSSPANGASSFGIGLANVETQLFNYPYARRDETKDILHDGKFEIDDPYRWMEKPSKERENFVQDQNKLFSNYVGTLNDATSTDTTSTATDFANQIEGRLTDMFNFEKHGCPFRRGDSYYYFHNSGLQPQDVLYKQDSLDGISRVFFDPNQLSNDGSVSLWTYSFSEDGNLFAYGLRSSGSDWMTIHVRSASDDAPEDLDPPIEWAKFTTIEFTHDNKGFFYKSYLPPAQISNNGDKGTETDINKNQRVMYHVIGSKDDDVLIHQDKENPNWSFMVKVSHDGKYLILYTFKGCDHEAKVYIADISGQDMTGGHLPITRKLSETPESIFSEPPIWNKIVDDFSASYDYVTNEGKIFYFQTTLNAPFERVVKYDLDQPELGMVNVIAETGDVIRDICVADKNKLVIKYLHNVKSIIKMYVLPTGTLLDYSLPLEEGSIIPFMRSRKQDTEVFYISESYTTPRTVGRFDFTTMESSVLKTTNINNYDPTKYEVKQVWYESTGNANVPMYIISKKNTPLDGNNPTLVYAYGGFGCPTLPSFSVQWLAFIEHMNGVVAVANIRGGGEFGEEWYRDGILRRKQNGIDDFKNAAKYLIDKNWTKPSKLTISGISNGGMIVAACANQNPELFGCVLADVGVMDLTRFHKFTIGHAWTPEYGNPEKKDEFENLIKFSPLQNVKTQKYPAYLVSTSDHDDRVVPLHSFKLIATLQHAVKEISDNPPIMMRVETKTGHGADKSRQKIIKQWADKFTFIAKSLELQVRE